jgi:hypothetical protein
MNQPIISFLMLKLTLFLVCVISIFSFSMENQKQILIKFFDSTNGNGWKRKDNWKEGNPCEKDKIWFGLKCSGDIVWSINLEKNGLGGVFNFKFLKV